MARVAQSERSYNWKQRPRTDGHSPAKLDRPYGSYKRTSGVAGRCPSARQRVGNGDMLGDDPRYPAVQNH